MRHAVASLTAAAAAVARPPLESAVNSLFSSFFFFNEKNQTFSMKKRTFSKKGPKNESNENCLQWEPNFNLTLDFFLLDLVQ